MAEDQIYRALYLQRQLVILLLGLESTFLLGLVVIESIFFKCKLCLFEQGISLSVFISVRHT